jgi:hypothetical protein
MDEDDRAAGAADGVAGGMAEMGGGTMALRALRQELEAIPADEVAVPVIPVDRLVGEGLALAASARQHAGELVGAGLDPALIAGLGVRAQALAEAQAQLLALRGHRRADELALERRAIELRSDMVAGGRYGLREDRDAQAVLDHIQEGEGVDDLIGDLRALAVFFRNRAPALARIGAQPDLTRRQAEETAGELEALLATRRGSDVGEGQAMDLRNRAATHLWAAMTHVRAAGAYAFRRQPRTLAKFRSAYNTFRRTGRRAPPPGSKPSS